MFGWNAHFQALAQRLLAALGSLFTHRPQIVHMCVCVWGGGGARPGSALSMEVC